MAVRTEILLERKGQPKGTVCNLAVGGDGVEDSEINETDVANKTTETLLNDLRTIIYANLSSTKT